MWSVAIADYHIICVALFFIKFEVESKNNGLQALHKDIIFL